MVQGRLILEHALDAMKYLRQGSAQICNNIAIQNALRNIEELCMGKGEGL